MAPARTTAFFGVVLLCVSSGCGRDTRPETVPVSGIVTLNGAPLANATVIFTPASPVLKPSRAITDSNGKYELTYLRDIKGAVLGNHEVRITTRTEHSPIEKLPAKYNSRSELSAEVAEPSGTFDFELKSE